jgi:processive 1,2-diacylglycerol beta-glucosyltransferase
MEALVLSCSTGGGHNAAAYAIKAALEEREWKVTFFDPYTLKSKKLSEGIAGAYLGLVGHSPAAFGRVYKIGSLYENAQDLLHLPNPLLIAQTRPSAFLAGYLKEHHFDVIICTHPFPGYMLTMLKRKRVPLPVTFLVATDYTCIPFEKEIETDYLIIGAPEITDEFLHGKYKEHQILPFGIPVNPAFTVYQKQEDLFQDFENRRIVLVAAGSMGLDSTFDLTQTLCSYFEKNEDVLIVTLCASNQQLKQKLEDLHLSNLCALGFTDKMAQLLQRASVYVTKPGGLSITEAAACGIPLVLIHPIPGCESRNADFFEKEGMALQAKDNLHAAILCRFLMDPKYGSLLVEAQKKALPQSAARHIAAFAELCVHKRKS